MYLSSTLTIIVRLFILAEVGSDVQPHAQRIMTRFATNENIDINIHYNDSFY